MSYRVIAAAPPCVTSSDATPCEELVLEISKSKRRKLRDRRVAVRKAIIDSNALKSELASIIPGSTNVPKSAPLSYNSDVVLAQLMQLHCKVDGLSMLVHSAMTVPLTHCIQPQETAYPGIQAADLAYQCGAAVKLQKFFRGLSARKKLSKAHYSDFDIIHMLGGMVSSYTLPVGGAVIETTFAVDPHTEFEGESLVNAAISFRADHARIVHVAKECSDKEKDMVPHIFSVGDVVHIGMERCPYVVKRVGYDFFREDMRVIRVGERDSYSAGKWVH